MKSLNLRNVVGCAENASIITPGLLGPMLSMSTPVGKRVPSNWIPPKGYTLEKVTINDVPLERLIPEGGSNGKVVLMFHGGAYVSPLLDMNRNLAITYSQITQGGEVVNVDYRVAPTDRYPAALNDCVTAYKTLLDFGYKGEDILLVGESAGGGLVLAVTLYLKDHHLPLPKALIAISPWTELAAIAPSHHINYEKDIILGKHGCSIANQLIEPDYCGTTDFKTPYLSPLYGDYTHFPPLLIQVGTYEILYNDATRVAHKAEKAGVNVTFSSYYGMCHCFQELLPELPESKLAWQEISNFINSYF